MQTYVQSDSSSVFQHLYLGLKNETFLLYVVGSSIKVMDR